MEQTETSVELRPITADEIMRILSGRRDFSRRVGRNLNLSGHPSFRVLREYLINDYFRENPITIEDSNFQGLIARDLHMPYLRGVNANLEGADLKGARLYQANLKGARLQGADLSLANLEGVTLHMADLRGVSLRKTELREAQLYGADLREADFTDANLYGVRFGGADLRGSVGLWDNPWIQAAIFGEGEFEDRGYRKTIVTNREKKIILKAITPEFDFREE